MRILKRDLKNGLVAVEAENLDDLWYLEQIIEEGDLVRGRTSRLVKAGERLRADKGRKEPMVLSIRVERVEFDENSSKLRILGRIEEGPEDKVSLGSHHTIELTEHERLDIRKGKWAEYHLAYLRDAQRSARRAKAIVCVVGDGEATIGLVRDRGVSYIDMHSNIGGKYSDGREEKKREFYSALLSTLGSLLEKEGAALILAGPGFEKRNFLEYCGSRLSAVVVDTGNEGRAGVNEVLKSSKMEKLLLDMRISVEARLVERLMAEIGRGGPVVYGADEVERALSLGAVDTLLITDAALRRERVRADDFIKKARASGAFHILNSRFEPGQRLDGLGGYAAILRYKI